MILAPIFFDNIRFECNPTQNYKNINLSELKKSLDTHKISPFDQTIFGLINDTDMEVFDYLRHEMQWIEAAGGIVTNDKGQILCIKRLGKWDLPKGKMEQGESTSDSALREVSEETHISELTLGEPLPTTYHLYFHKDRWVIKPTYWYRMQTTQQKTIPQTEEGITEVRWMSSDEIQTEFLPNTYLSLEWLLKQL